MEKYRPRYVIKSKGQGMDTGFQKGGGTGVTGMHATFFPLLMKFWGSPQKGVGAVVLTQDPTPLQIRPL